MTTIKHNTGIEWTHIPGYRGETWNPVTGCTKVSPGCTNCYIERSIPFRFNGHKFEYDADAKSVSTPIMLHSNRLDRPRHWKMPRTIFVNSLSDLFHDDIPDSFILDVWKTMRDTPQHIYMILTKRPERMKEFVNRIAWHTSDDGRAGYVPYLYDDGDEPLKNVWLGTSVENQTWADRRVPILLETHAAVRFLSCEPLLGRVSVKPWLPQDVSVNFCQTDLRTPEARQAYEQLIAAMVKRLHPIIDWVLVGGESGPGARPMRPKWATDLRDECQAAGVPFFFKQWGEYADALNIPGYFKPVTEHDALERFKLWPNGEVSIKVGKKAAGALLDGREWLQFPKVVSNESL